MGRGGEGGEGGGGGLRRVAAQLRSLGPPRNTLQNPLQLDDGIDETFLISVFVHRRSPALLCAGEADSISHGAPLSAAEWDRRQLPRGLEIKRAGKGRTTWPGRGQTRCEQVLTLLPMLSSLSASKYFLGDSTGTGNSISISSPGASSFSPSMGVSDDGIRSIDDEHLLSERSGASSTPVSSVAAWAIFDLRSCTVAGSSKSGVLAHAGGAQVARTHLEHLAAAHSDVDTRSRRSPRTPRRTGRRSLSGRTHLLVVCGAVVRGGGGGGGGWEAGT